MVHFFFVLILLSSSTAFRIRWKSSFYGFHLANKNDHLNDIQALANFKSSEKLTDEELKEVEEVIKEESPSELTIRMNIAGITPFTIVGLAVALVLITLKNSVGTGWLSNFLGLGTSDTEDIAQVSLDDDTLRKSMQMNSIVNYEDIDRRLEELHTR